MLQQLASFPGLKTGRSYSAVVFDRFQARPALRRFSIPECWAGAGNEATSAAARAAPLAFSYVLGLLNLCCICSAAGFNSVPGAVSRSILRFSLRLVRCLRGSLREHDCAMSTIDPRSFTLRTSISTTPGLRFTSGTRL